MEVVLDASVAVLALAVRDDTVLPLHERLAAVDCVAPHLIDAEVGSVLRRRVAAGAVEATSAAAALRGLEGLVAERYPHGPLAASAWGLRHNLTYYDALYVALAERLAIPLLTADARLARAPGLPCAVEVIE
jgi:predicted nucleic acid-binding protein